jgi:DNA mismatch repair protein MutS
MSKTSPMMEQYQAIKNQNPDSLLFFRLGDFYELFGEDAKEASHLLNITLTARSSGEGRSVRVPMAGVPYHAAPAYIQKLLRAGKKVAICEQMESPKEAKGNIRRELVRVITPGTALEDGFLDSKSNNYILALWQGKMSLGLAACDNTTGDFFAAELARGELEGELARLRPAEILLSEGSPAPLTDSESLISFLDDYSFSGPESLRILKEHFGVASLEGFGFKDENPALRAAGALLGYLKKTQKSGLSHITQLRSHHGSEFMGLDASAQRHLELSANQEDGGKRATLFEVLDRSQTAAGGRMLKRWIHSPLMDLGAIGRRQDAVAEMLGQGELRDALGACLQSTTDVERAVGKVGCLAANARDLASIRQTLRELPNLVQALASGKAEALARWQARDLLLPLRELLERTLLDDPPLGLRDGGMIRPGVSAELDRVIADSHGGRDLVLGIQERERELTGNPKLKVQFNSIFGFYIEVSKAQSAQVPGHYERKQTLVNAERFTTPDLKAVEARVLSAEERRKDLEFRLFEELRAQVAAVSAALLALAADLAELDCLLSLALTALELDYVRPEMVEAPLLEIEGGRHAVVEALMRKGGGPAFVANDCRLNADSLQLMLITGPNMAGKSTYMRQVALIVLMAQMGSFVPARRARLGLVDRLFTRVGASDRLSRGMSTFLVEMTETANILRHATRRSLVVLDEIGRGTSTYDGVSIAWAVAEQLHESPSLGCRTLFATHYFELTELETRFKRIKNFCVAVREWAGKIIFMHEIKPGSSEHSYGIAVARLAGVPEAVLERAKGVLAGLERDHQSASRGAAAAPQLGLFPAPLSPEEKEMIEGMRRVDPDTLTPIQALQLVHDWHGRLGAQTPSAKA